MRVKGKNLKKSPALTTTILTFIVLLISFGGRNLPSQTDEDTEKNIVAGYALYEDWITSLEVPAPTKLHPLWVVGEIESGKSWLCESCHGNKFNGSGNNGVSLWNVAKLQTIDVENWLFGRENPEHDFSLYFNEKSIEELSALLKYGVADMIVLFDPDSGNILGDSISGEANYKMLCGSCHGLDGARINFGGVNNPYFIGDMVINNPWEVAKTVRFGHQQVAVLSSFQTGLSLLDVADLVSYVELFPLSQTIQANQPVEIDFSDQGNTIDIIYGAMLIVGVIFLGVMWGERVRFQ